jgi:hypothetical protein
MTFSQQEFYNEHDEREMQRHQIFIYFRYMYVQNSLIVSIYSSQRWFEILIYVSVSAKVIVYDIVNCSRSTSFF